MMHRWIEAHQERPGEVSLWCSCGFHLKHLQICAERGTEIPLCGNLLAEPSRSGGQIEPYASKGYL